MNKAVSESGQDDIFVTLIYVVLDAGRKQIQLANAGHMPPIVRRRDEDDVIVLDRTSGLPLGVLPEPEYATETFDLSPGDSVMLFTDGLVEAMSPSREMFGMERLTAAIAKQTSNAATLVDRAVQDCQHHVGDAPQFDDTTIVCFGLEEQTRIQDVDTSPAGNLADDARIEAMQRIRRLRGGKQ